jgi:hypothetical protein
MRLDGWEGRCRFYSQGRGRPQGVQTRGRLIRGESERWQSSSAASGLGGAPFVSMMQTANLWNRDDATGAGRSDGTRNRCVLGQRQNVSATARTSRQPNTHSTESREVCYPWHPWFGRSVVVYERLVKKGHAVCWCGLEEERNRRSLEIPTWMFEPAACLSAARADRADGQLRVHVGRGLASGQAQEAGNE